MTDEQKKKKDEQEAQVPPVPAPSTAEMERTHADELAALQQAQADELRSLQQVNEQRYKDVGDIVAEAEAKLGTMKVDDETAQKRSEAFRYIAGLGDTLSGLANVVGTSFGAQNQQQTYNGGYVAEKAEQARKERKLEMDKISSRLDEMRAREKDLRTAGSLAEAELKAKQARETVQLKREQKALEREAKYKERMLAVDEKNAETSRINAEKGKGTTSPTKPKYVTIQQPDGTTTQMDVSAYKDFWGDYQRVLDAAIADGTSGLSEDEIKAYNDAVKLAKADNKKALNEFLRTHTPRQAVVDRMKSVTLITSNYP